MKALAFGPALFASVVTLASGVAPVSELLAPPLMQGGILAVLSWTIWYVFARVLPAHNKALESQRDAFLGAIKEEREATRELYESFKKS